MINSDIILMLTIFLLPSIYFDIKSRKIPNWLTLPAILMGVMFHILSNGRDGFFFSIFGLVFGIGLLLLPFFMGGMGAGDVKLMGAIGSMAGPVMMFKIFLVSAIIGLLSSIILVVAVRQYRIAYSARVKRLLSRPSTSPGPAPKNRAFPRVSLPYGVVLAAGTLVSIILFP